MARVTSAGDVRQPGLSVLDGLAMGVFAAPVMLFLLVSIAPRSDGQDGWLYATAASLASAGVCAAVGSSYVARKVVLVGFGGGLAGGVIACTVLMYMIGSSIGS